MATARKVFVAGATGVAGRRAVQALAARGHEVSAVARSSEKAELLRGFGAEPVTVDLFDPVAVKGAVAGHDAIVNLATKIPPMERALLPGAWSENDQIRREVSRNLVDAALECNADVFVQEALGFIYPDSGDDWVTEETPVDPPPHAASVLDAEGHCRRMTTSGKRGVVLRFGQFYTSDSAHITSMLKTARRGFFPLPGPPESFSPWIHGDDIASAVVAGLGAPAGTYNVVDNEPLRQGDIAEIFAKALGVEKLRFPPGSVMKLGGKKLRMLMRSQRVSNKKLRETTGWEPRWPSMRTGLPAVLAEAGSS